MYSSTSGQSSDKLYCLSYTLPYLAGRDTRIRPSHVRWKKRWIVFDGTGVDAGSIELKPSQELFFVAKFLLLPAANSIFLHNLTFFGTFLFPSNRLLPPLLNHAHCQRREVLKHFQLSAWVIVIARPALLKPRSTRRWSDFSELPQARIFHYGGSWVKNGLEKVV